MNKGLFTPVLLLCLAVLGIGLALITAPTTAASSPERSLAELLKPDGTLDLTTGYYGSLDGRGWQLVSGPNEAPRFAPLSAPGPLATDANWASNFNLPGTNSQVFALAVDQNDSLFLGGSFQTAGSSAASFIAQWSGGNNWSTVGALGMNDWPLALAIDRNGILYAGGWFGYARDPSRSSQGIANFVAKWDGISWSALGSGMNERVRALAVDSSNTLYAGGSFTMAGGIPANYVAQWNGSAWSALGDGFNKTVNALAVDSNDTVYAGGVFTQTGATTVNYVAQWNGSAWSALAGGFTAPVNAFVVDSSDRVYAGGSFTQTGATTVNYVAQWNGSAWSALGSGFISPVSALARDSHNNIFAGGNMALICGDATCTSGDVPTYSIARWNGSVWSPLGTGDGVGGNVNALARDAVGNVYAGGSFYAAGATLARNVARWNGSAWSALGNGFLGSVNALGLDGSGNLYAGGAFNQVCDATCSGASTTVNHVAKWDGSAWSALGNGLNNTVNSLTFDNSGNLYAGGAFTAACDATCSGASTPVNYMAKWNGSAWSAVGNGFNNVVYALTVDSGNNVYAGGSFTLACDATCGASSVPAARVAKWNRTAWSGVGGGVANVARALAVDAADNVYVGGDFTSTGAGGFFRNRIARWNGSVWEAVGLGFDNTVNAIVVDGATVYAGGTFVNAEGISANRVARWDGSQWTSLGSGLNSSANALVLVNKNLYVGGGFTSAGAKVSMGIARYMTGQLLLPFVTR